MRVSVINSKLSKSQKSVNFNFNKKWFSVKRSLLEEMGIEYEDFNNIEIEVIDQMLVNGWTMIHDFEITSEVKEKIIDFNNINDVSEPKRKIKVTRTVKEQEEIIESFSFDGINPFEVVGEKYSDSYINKVFVINDYRKLKKPINGIESHISVIQNFILRGKCNPLISKKVSGITCVTVLELFKRGYTGEEVKVLIPANESFKNVLEEINEFIDIFNKIFLKFDIKKWKDFVSKITNNVKSHADKIMILNNDNKQLLEIKFHDETKLYSQMTFITEKNIKYNIKNTNKQYFDKLLKLAFYNKETKITSLKDEQYKSLEYMMNNNKNVLAVLKTGFGKSLIYQFSTLLQSRIFIAVFPINSLISDQYISVRKSFNFGYFIDNSELKKKTSKQMLNLLTRKRVFLVTPERLENEMVQNHFESLSSAIGFMVFDEAHCISEWGHDFRPSYLMSKHLMHSISKKSDLVVLALTATAAPHIQNDVARLLTINKRNIINIADGSGLERKEITYDLIPVEVNDFDRWNRSEMFSNIIDNKIIESYNECTQGIAFFMKAGSERDLEKDKYWIKNNAFSTYNRLDIDDIALYTGKNKIISNSDQKQFENFVKMKYIIATKSFGMGVNLKNCDYVLLSEPPYSLEDLYQQSGRVGRMGQKSKVEILYHERNLIDPLNSLSPYQFFLSIDDKRIDNQKKSTIIIINEILNDDEYITLNLKDIMYGNKGMEQTHIQWAIAHLITEFKIIEKYSVQYSFLNISHIKIKLTKANWEEKEIIERINKVNEKLEIMDSNSIVGAIDNFYEYYFNKLQNDKIIGINILRDRLNEIYTLPDVKDDSKVITECLTTYYKTRTDDLDKFVINLYEKIKEGSPKDYLLNLFKQNRKLESFEIMESISRYQIQVEYIKIATLLCNVATGEAALIDNLKNILTNKFENNELDELRTEIIIDNILIESEKSHLLELQGNLVTSKKYRDIFEYKILLESLRSLNEE